jgi:hypothetical protein
MYSVYSHRLLRTLGPNTRDVYYWQLVQSRLLELYPEPFLLCFLELSSLRINDRLYDTVE